MMKQLFVTDLDGTLLSSGISVSPYTAQVLNELMAKGVLITYATSRSFYTTQKLLKDVRFELPCITFNGVYVIRAGTGEILRKNVLDREIFDFVIREGENLGLRPFVFGKVGDSEKLLYGPPANDAQARFLRERQRRGDRRLCPDTGDIRLDEIITVTFLYPMELLEPLKRMLEAQFGARISVKIIRDIYNPGYYSLEISHKHANKGDMLRWLGEFLGIPMENVTVFGDQANDEELFRAAGTRVAVENAAEELKKLADAVIGTNDADSVAKYLLRNAAR